MRTLTALLLLFFLAIDSSGQTRYEKGYFIDNDNQRIDCLIQKKDWKNNPSEFSYKLDDSSAPAEGDITSVKEFGLPGNFKFIRADVKIDHSNTLAISSIGDENPNWGQELLFLKVLLEGRAKLYSVDNKYGKKFFYSVADSAINQLVYKRFFVGSSLAENNSFKDQLLMDLSCPNAGMESVEHITYTTEDLEKYFHSYNRCMGGESFEVHRKDKEK